MPEKTLLARVLAARPKGSVDICGETYNIRMPSEAAMRSFRTQTADPVAAKAALFEDAVLDSDGALITHDEALQLANASWASKGVLAKIMEVSGVTPAAGAEDDPEKETDAG